MGSVPSLLRQNVIIARDACQLIVAEKAEELDALIPEVEKLQEHQGSHIQNKSRKSRKFATDMSTTNEKYREDLTAYLLEVATGSGHLKGTLLNTPDLDEAWQRYAPSFYGDAVREFNAYPEYCLACAGYLGMAVAHLWDKDWPKPTIF